jgi:hypothetical protein
MCYLLFGLMLWLAIPLAADQSKDLRQTLTAGVPGQPLIEGEMDWTNGVLTAYGEGVAPKNVDNPVTQRLMGFRAAKLAALRNLVEVVGQLQVDSRTTVSMAMVTEDSISTQVSAILQGARIVSDSRQEIDGAYRLAVSVPLGAEFVDLVLPGDTAYADTTADLVLPPKSLPAADSLVVFVPPKPYTGLIVDGRGLDLRPSISPRILSEDGREIYSATFVEREYAVRFGVVGYDKDLERAMTSDRIGGEQAHPFVVQAKDVYGLYNADVMISRDAGIRVRMANAERDFLQECRVIFVLGPVPKNLDTSFRDSLMHELQSIDAAKQDSLRALMDAQR